MMLSDELEQAAQALGQSLRAAEAVRTYLDAQSRVQANPETNSLEVRLSERARGLMARQRAGEQLAESEVNEFYTLRHQMLSQPLIADRDLALSQLKSYLMQVALDLSEELGVDYTALAQRA